MSDEQQHGNTLEDSSWNWRDRIRFRLFPILVCDLPEAPATWKDVLVCETTVILSWSDRIRALVCGRIHVETKTVTENTIGGCVTSSIAYPVLRGKREH